jgi:hypothetical protein
VNPYYSHDPASHDGRDTSGGEWDDGEGEDNLGEELNSYEDDLDDEELVFHADMYGVD